MSRAGSDGGSAKPGRHGAELTVKAHLVHLLEDLVRRQRGSPHLDPTPEQVGAALRAAPDHFHAFVAVCAFAGLRPGEAAGLQLGDVDFLRRTMSIKGQIQDQVNSKTIEVSPKYESAGRSTYPTTW